MINRESQKFALLSKNPLEIYVMTHRKQDGTVEYTYTIDFGTVQPISMCDNWMEATWYETREEAESKIADGARKIYSVERITIARENLERCPVKIVPIKRDEVHEVVPLAQVKSPSDWVQYKLICTPLESGTITEHVTKLEERLQSVLYCWGDCVLLESCEGLPSGNLQVVLQVQFVRMKTLDSVIRGNTEQLKIHIVDSGAADNPRFGVAVSKEPGKAKFKCPCGCEFSASPETCKTTHSDLEGETSVHSTVTFWAKCPICGHECSDLRIK